MHKRLAALPRWQAAEHQRGGDREMVSIPWVEGRTVAPRSPRASPPAARYARASRRGGVENTDGQRMPSALYGFYYGAGKIYSPTRYAQAF